MSRRRTPPPSPEFRPMRMETVEIGARLAGLAPPGETRAGLPFAGSLCLVLLHDQPLGMVAVELGPAGVDAEALAAAIERELGAQIAAHLRADGLPARPLTAAGLSNEGQPACLEEREQLLADPPRLSVIISTRNRPDSVKLTLASILACRYPSERWEVIVVDNAAVADPGIAAAAAAIETEVPVRVVHEPLPGLSNARNRGLAAASGEIVVYADDDVEVNRDWLLVLAAPFRRDERVGASSGMTLPGALETPVQRWTEAFGGRTRPLRKRRFDLAEPPPDRPPFPFTVGEFGAGRNMAFRRELLFELGGFDPALGPGTIAHDGDDIEALLRVILAGRAVFHDPAAIVWHAHPEEWEELEKRVLGYGAGLSAALTKALLDHPRLALDLARKLPAGIRFAVARDSEKNVGRPPDFPRRLARRELQGLAYGPLAYLRSRRAARRLLAGRAPLDVAAAGAGPAATAGADKDPASAPGKLRILIVSDEYKPVVGGAARNLELLARQLTRRGHAVAVVTSWQPNAPGEERDGEVAVHRVRDILSHARWLSDDPQRHHPPPFPDLEAIAGMRRVIRQFQPDVVHAYGWMASSAAAALAGSRIPLLLSTHDYGNFCAQFTLVRRGETCSGPGPLKCLACSASTYGAAKGAVAVGGIRASQALLRRRTTAIQSVSAFTASAVDRHLRVPGITPVVVPNFLEPSSDEPLEEEILGALPSQPFIMFVGHLRGYKGLPVLLAAYERMQAPAPPLVLVGTVGPDTPESFPDGVRVFTYVPHGTVMEMWRRASFGVSPSIAPEALPSVVLESMSAGRPMIGSDLGGYRDLIEDGVSGLLVRPNDPAALAAAMTRLADDAELRERLGRAAAERAAQFSPDLILPRFEEVYRGAIAKAGRK